MRIQFTPLSTGYIRSFKTSDLRTLREEEVDCEFIWASYAEMDVPEDLAEVILDRHGDQFREVTIDESIALDDARPSPKLRKGRAQLPETPADPIND